MSSSPKKSRSPVRGRHNQPAGGAFPLSAAILVDSDSSKTKKNSNGGVMITREEIKCAFDFLDADQTGRLSLANLKGKLGVFFPDMTAKEYRFLMNNKRELTLDDLAELLIDNEVTNFDPVQEAFNVGQSVLFLLDVNFRVKAYDQNGDGYISGNRLKEIFSYLGFGEISNEEITVLTKVSARK